MIREIWKDIGKFEPYQASNLGRIRNKKTGRIRKQHNLKIKLKYGDAIYRGISIQVNKKPVHKSSHTLIALAFFGKRPKGKEVNHKDSDGTNNKITNLEYVTHSENMLHGYRYGRKIKCKGELHPLSKFKENQIKKIRKLAQTKTQKEIAFLYKVDPSTVSYIISKKTWSHI